MINNLTATCCVFLLIFNWFECKASGAGPELAAQRSTDYKYLDGKLRINATFVLLVIFTDTRPAQSTVCQVYIPMSKKKHKSLKL